jgi:membrane-associated phospholipid phosphatase
MEPFARRQVVREISLIALAIFTYFAVRNMTAGSPGVAFENARRVVRFEDGSGLDWEHGAQALTVRSDTLVDLANWIYIWGHWPVILTTALVLFLFRRERYFLLRNTLFLSGAIGFLFFALFPVAPPRLMDLGLLDTVTTESHAYRALQPPGLTNQYAAFPSLHAGWNVLIGIVLFTTTTAIVVRVFAIALPVAMSFAVVATANHYVVDVAAGIAVVLVGLLVVSAWANRPIPAIVEGSARDPGHGVPTAVRDRAPRRQPSRRAARRRTPRHPARRG